MRRPARVEDAARVWQVLHQQASAASMIEVNMRQEDKVDITDVKTLLLQPVQKERNAVIRPGIDESAPAALDNEVTRVL
jgi:hypothetical protein